MNILEIGKNIKEFREKRGLSGDELANKLGKSGNSYVSKIENGKREAVNLKELIEISDALDCTLSDLIGEEADRPRRKTFWDNPKFREEDVIKDEAKESINKILPKISKTYRINQQLGLEPVKFGWMGKIIKKSQAEALAQEVRHSFDLGMWGIDIFALVKDMFNIYVISEDLGEKISGFYSTDSKGNPVIVVNDAVAYSQRNVFTLAHELGHYLIDSENSFVDSINNDEDLADSFAAELLIPKQSLRKLATRFPDDEDLIVEENIIHIAEVFKVSYGAVLRRLVDLTLISMKTKERLKSIPVMSNARYKPEEYYKPLSIDEQIRRDLLIAIQKKKIGRTKAESVYGDLIE